MWCRCKSAPSIWPSAREQASYWAYFLGRSSCSPAFLFRVARPSRLDFYSPIATLAERGYTINGQTFWIIGMVFLITSSLLGAGKFHRHHHSTAAKGMTWMRLPFLSGAVCDGVPAVAGLSPLEAAAVMQLMDNLGGTSFFLRRLVVSGTPLPPPAAAVRCCGSIYSGSWAT